MKEHPVVNEDVVSIVTTAYNAYLAKNLPLIDPHKSISSFQETAETAYANVFAGKSLDGTDKPGDKEAKIKMHINTAAPAAAALASKLTSVTNGATGPQRFFSDTQEIMLPYLDAEKGATVPSDNYSIFTALTQRYEERFMQDTRDLNILDPDVITRVTEYMPRIVEFVERIVKNNCAYVTSDGSVYFDITSFEAQGNDYARLRPWNRNDTALLADGEGSLIAKTTEKRSEADFALWKASKPGEPSWPSPWGGGRPGWHIECSAMASGEFGKQFDIHSGGVDLAFPHHDNELAQSEAYWHDHDCHDQWVNYFVHMGHLSIQGSKMSKSLKNYTTIRKALEMGEWTSRSLRIVFLLGSWKDGIEVTDDLVQMANGWEERVNNFFINARDSYNGVTDSSLADDSLKSALDAAKRTTYEDLCNSFNTPGVMAAISELIGKYHSADKSRLPAEDVQAAAQWVTSMVNIFGLNGNATADSTEIGWSGIDVPESAKMYLYPLSEMRDTLRQAAIAKATTTESLQSANRIGKEATEKATDDSVVSDQFRTTLSSFCNEISSLDAASDSANKDILSLCDRLRDVDLFDLGVYLEDRENKPALVRPVTRELAQARQEKEERARQKLHEKEEREKEAAKRAEKGKLSHLEMFKQDTKEYSEWDADGIPTKDAEGNEIPKSRAKKLRKDWERQKKLHEAWLAGQKQQ